MQLSCNCLSVCTWMLQRKKDELASLRAALHAPAGGDEQRCAICSALGCMRRAACMTHIVVPCRQLQLAQRTVSELAGALGQAPDPLPVLQAVGALQLSLADAQRQNRQLQGHMRAADSEASTASGAVLRCRELEREVAELRREAAAQVLARYCNMHHCRLGGHFYKCYWVTAELLNGRQYNKI